MKFVSNKSNRNSASLTMSVAIAVGCTSYGRGENQVEVDRCRMKIDALNLLQQINELEVENADLKNQVEVLQYETRSS